MNNETLQAYYVEGIRDKIAEVLQKEAAYPPFDKLLRQKKLSEPVTSYLRKYLDYIDEGSDISSDAMAKIQREFLSGRPSKDIQPTLPGFGDMFNKQSAAKEANERGPYLSAVDRYVEELGIEPMYMDEDGGNASWIEDIGHDSVMELDTLMRAEGWGQEKEAGLASVIARMKQPLRTTGWKRPSKSNKVIHRILNTINPQLGKKYQRHVEFKPKAFGSYSSKTPGRTTEWDMPITDRLLDVAEDADALAYNVSRGGVPRTRANDLVAKMRLHRRNQTRSLSSPFRNLFTDTIS